MDEGRRLASERDDLIAAGVDPAELLVPLAPLGPGPCPDCGHPWPWHSAVSGVCEVLTLGTPCGCTARLVSAAQPYERLHEYEVEVTSVQDGDTLGGDLDLGFTFAMRKIAVRFIGVDSPELTVKVNGKVVINPPGEPATLALMAMLGRERFAATRSRGYFGRPGPYLLAPGAEPLWLLVRSELGSDTGTEKYGRVFAEVWLPGEDPAVTPSLGARMVAAGYAVPDPPTTT